MAQDSNPTEFAVYLLEAEADDAWVEQRLADRLANEANLRPYFFNWEGIPGVSRRDSMLAGFTRSASCAVCLGKEALSGLVHDIQQIALDRKSKVAPGNPPFRLIPVILPGGDPKSTPQFLEDVTQVDFRNEDDFDWQFHLLVCGIKGEPPGPRPRPNTNVQTAATEAKGDKDQLQAAFVAILQTIDVAERATGLSQKEASSFRQDAFSNIQKRLLDLSVEQVKKAEPNPTTLKAELVDAS